ncbi:MAG: hypothetical protein R3C61_10190 [Bacteroidia bacterium]
MKTGWLLLLLLSFASPAAIAGQAKDTDPYAQQDEPFKKWIKKTVTTFGGTTWKIVLLVNGILLGVFAWIGTRALLRRRKRTRGQSTSPQEGEKYTSVPSFSDVGIHCFYLCKSGAIQIVAK